MFWKKLQNDETVLAYGRLTSPTGETRWLSVYGTIAITSAGTAIINPDRQPDGAIIFSLARFDRRENTLVDELTFGGFRFHDARVVRPGDPAAILLDQEAVSAAHLRFADWSLVYRGEELVPDTTLDLPGAPAVRRTGPGRISIAARIIERHVAVAAVETLLHSELAAAA